MKPSSKFNIKTDWYLLKFASIFVIICLYFDLKDERKEGYDIEHQLIEIDHIHLDIIMENSLKFTGITTLDITILNTINKIKLHSGPNLLIESIKVNDSVISNWIHVEMDVISLNYGFLPNRSYLICIHYSSSLNSGGFHLLENYHSVSFTNFEPISSRTGK